MNQYLSHFCLKYHKKIIIKNNEDEEYLTTQIITYIGNKRSLLGFIGDAIEEVKKDIDLPFPIFSNYDCEIKLYKEDANNLVNKLDLVDLIYMDSPYNQHPYGSNYFMLNIINDYQQPEDISAVSGIPKNWNRSKFNQAKAALKTFENLCNNAKAKFLLISFNSNGFIKKEEMINMLSKIGSITVMEKNIIPLEAQEILITEIFMLKNTYILLRYLNIKKWSKKYSF